MRRLSAGHTRGLETRLACLLTWSGSHMSGRPTAHGIRGVSAWCSRSAHVVHVVADQEHSDCAVPRYWYRMELIWRFVKPTAHARTEPLDNTKMLFHIADNF